MVCLLHLRPHLPWVSSFVFISHLSHLTESSEEDVEEDLVADLSGVDEVRGDMLSKLLMPSLT